VEEPAALLLLLLLLLLLGKEQPPAVLEVDRQERQGLSPPQLDLTEDTQLPQASSGSCLILFTESKWRGSKRRAGVGVGIPELTGHKGCMETHLGVSRLHL